MINSNGADIKVSVICEVYNHEKYLRECLNSLVNQKTNFDYEIIVNDDCSTDSSAQIIKEFEEKYPNKIVPILQEKNLYSQGINIPFEIMIPKSLGDYICFCEGDDFWASEDKLQKQFDSLEANKNASFSVHKVSCVFEDSKPSGKVIPSPDIESKITGNTISQEDFAKLVLCGNYPFQTSSYFMRRTIFDPINSNVLPISRMTNGDYGMLYLALISGDVTYINEEMSCYRLASNGSWSSMHPKTDILEVKNRFDSSIKTEELVDKFTSGKFDELFKASSARHILSWSDKFPKEAKERLKAKGVNAKIIRKYLNFKYSVYYALLFTCPKLHTFIKFLGRKFK